MVRFGIRFGMTDRAVLKGGFEGNFSSTTCKMHSLAMISNEPEADADELDDDQVLEAYLGIDAPHPTREAARRAIMPDWPLARTRDVGLTLDSETLAWFQARHADWRTEMRYVLRAWTVARSRAETISPQSP